MIRLLVVDDSAVFRRGMQDLFAAIEEVEVVGVAADGASGVDVALELQPDIALMDLAMPGLPGIEATRRLSAAAPHIGVVVMTMLEDDDAVLQALRAGARGYLVKGARQNEILDVIRGVHAGRAVIGRPWRGSSRRWWRAARRRSRSPTSRRESGTSSPPRGRREHRAGRGPARAVRQDRPQPRLFDSDKARGARSHAGRAQGARGGPAALTAARISAPHRRLSTIVLIMLIQ
jgi:DNA-binding NarL/FixJ family response regulator